MKVLMLTSSYPIKHYPNSGTFVQNMVWGLKARGIDVSVLIFSPIKNLNTYCDKMGIKVIEYPYSLFLPHALDVNKSLIDAIKESFLAKIELPIYFLTTLFYLMKYSKESDIVHAHWFIPSGLIAAVNKVFIKRPLVVTACGAEFHLKNNFFTRTVLKFVYSTADYCVAVSDYLKNVSQEYFINQMAVIPNNTNPNKFKPTKVKLEKEKIIIGVVRRLVPEKRVQDLLIAISIMKGVIKRKIKIHIIGDGPERKKLEELTKKLKIHKMVKFFGTVNYKRLNYHLNLMDIVVNPSIQEGMATANLEAMACGKPLIATNFCGNDEVIENGKTGFLYKPRDRYDLAKKLKLLVENESLRKRMGKEARNKVIKEFSISKISKKYAELYLNLVKNKV